MKNQERNIGYDLLRIFACFLVVMSHVSAKEILTLPVPGVKWSIAHLYNTFGHSGTILFFFLSGALLLREEYSFQYKKFYLGNFLNLAVTYYIWVVLYYAVGLVSRGTYTRAELKDVVIGIIEGNAGYHFWYLPTLLSIYLILPMLRAICKSGRQTVSYFVILFVVLQLGFTTVRLFDFPYKIYAESLMTRIPFTLVTHYVGYFVLGYWLTGIRKDKNVLKRYYALLFAGGPVLGLLGDMVLTGQAGANVVELNSVFSLTMCMSAVGIFGLLGDREMQASGRRAAAITEISKMTFGIYMIHPLFLNLVCDSVLYEKLPILFAVPICTLAVFLISFAVIFVLGRIPGIRKWVLYAGKKHIV